MPARLLILFRLIFRIYKFFVRPSGTFSKLFRATLIDLRATKSLPLGSFFIT